MIKKKLVLVYLLTYPRPSTLWTMISYLLYYRLLWGSCQIRGFALHWFKSFKCSNVSCRTQYVQYNAYNSSSKYHKCGVPQGSMLGSLSFLLYNNDLNNVSRALDFILFADDTNWWKLWITNWRNFQAGFRLISFLLT